MENKIKNSKIESNIKQWIFFALIIVSVLIPQVGANQFTVDFVLGYSTGDEYQMWKIVSGLAGAFITYLFLKDFDLSRSFSIVMSLLALVPLIRLILVVALVLIWSTRKITAETTVSTLTDRLKNITLTFVGYIATYNFIFGVTGLILLSAEESVISNLLRLSVSAIIFYFINTQRIYLSQVDLIGYVIGATILAFYMFS